jgi:hypothetical protein
MISLLYDGKVKRVSEKRKKKREELRVRFERVL